MPYVKLVLEIYKDYNALQNLLGYIMNPDKTCQDSKRSGYVKDVLCGCSPFWFPHAYECSPLCVCSFFYYCIMSLKPFTKNWALHRIISFAPGDYVLPEDVFNLGRVISDYYNKAGYITAFGVHCDKYNLHIHIAVCPVNMFTGNLYNNYYEYEELKNLTNRWYSLQEDRIFKNPSLKEHYDNLLFGDDLRSNTAFNTTRQIQINKIVKNKR